MAWKSKADEYRHKTGSSISKSSPREAFDERGHTPPLNAMECGKSRCERFSPSETHWSTTKSDGMRNYPQATGTRPLKWPRGEGLRQRFSLQLTMPRGGSHRPLIIPSGNRHRERYGAVRGYRPACPAGGSRVGCPDARTLGSVPRRSSTAVQHAAVPSASTTGSRVAVTSSPSLWSWEFQSSVA